MHLVARLPKIARLVISHFILLRDLTIRQSLMAFMQELDNTLFEAYARPKAEAVTAILRGGILDPQMDWYETARPLGSLLLPSFCSLLSWLTRTTHRNPGVHVRNTHVPRPTALASH